MPTTKQIFIGSIKLLRAYTPKTKHLHLLLWLSGLVIINLPSLKLTIGNFHSDDYSLLIPSLYGLLLNAFLFYGIAYLINRQKSPPPMQILHQSLVLFGFITLVESQLDALYFALFHGSINLTIYIDILIGSILMNAILFYFPALIFGVLQCWSQQQISSQRIRVKDGQQDVYLATEEVLLVESDRNYAIFHTTRGRLLQRTTLARLEEELPQQFTRCHRSFIINQYHIEKRRALEVVIAGKVIPVGRKYKDNIKVG